MSFKNTNQGRPRKEPLPKPVLRAQLRMSGFTCPLHCWGPEPRPGERPADLCPAWAPAECRRPELLLPTDHGHFTGMMATKRACREPGPDKPTTSSAQDGRGPEAHSSGPASQGNHREVGGSHREPPAGLAPHPPVAAAWGKRNTVASRRRPSQQRSVHSQEERGMSCLWLLTHEEGERPQAFGARQAGGTVVGGGRGWAPGSAPLTITSDACLAGLWGL